MNFLGRLPWISSVSRPRSSVLFLALSFKQPSNYPQILSQYKELAL